MRPAHRPDPRGTGRAVKVTAFVRKCATCVQAVTPGDARKGLTRCRPCRVLHPGPVRRLTRAVHRHHTAAQNPSHLFVKQPPTASDTPNAWGPSRWEGLPQAGFTAQVSAWRFHAARATMVFARRPDGQTE